MVPEKTTVVFSEDRSPQATRPLRDAVEELLSGRSDVELIVAPHLYDLAPDGLAAQYLRAAAGDMIVLASFYARATHWLLDAYGVKGRMGGPAAAAGSDSPAPVAAVEPGRQSQRTIWCLDLRSYRQAESLREAIGRILGDAAGSGSPPIRGGDLPGVDRPVAIAEDVRMRWYPVIDYDRCQNCMECLNFCLFGVFGIDDSEQILVEQPDACRPGCPACSRVCPSQAIMFPQHQTPVIAGDPTASQDGFDLGLVQLLGTLGPQELAVAERTRALAEQSRPPGPKTQPKKPEQPPREKDHLDRLVDELDETDL